MNFDHHLFSSIQRPDLSEGIGKPIAGFTNVELIFRSPCSTTTSKRTRPLKARVFPLLLSQCSKRKSFPEARAHDPIEVSKLASVLVRVPQIFKQHQIKKKTLEHPFHPHKTSHFSNFMLTHARITVPRFIVRKRHPTIVNFRYS